jgi:argininosuccinate lyase
VTALDLAEVLVERGVPFREAHEAVGRLVAWMISSGKDLSEVTAGELESAHQVFIPSDLERTDPLNSVRARRSPGGGSFESVARQTATLRDFLARSIE